jgi:hypothetical protein
MVGVGDLVVVGDGCNMYYKKECFGLCGGRLMKKS